MTLAQGRRRFALAAAIVACAAVGAVFAAPVIATDVPVSIVGKTFEPAHVEVAPGDTVVWTVTEEMGEPHSVTSGTIGADDAGALFDSGLEVLSADGEIWTFTFDTPGTYDYFCLVHAAEMTGQVVVAEGVEGEAHGIPFERRMLAGGILAATLVVCFGAAWVWRRMNPA